MDGAYLLGFGPRTADAIRDLAAALYGDQHQRTDGATWRSWHRRLRLTAMRRPAARTATARAARGWSSSLLAVLALARTVLFSLGVGGIRRLGRRTSLRDWLSPSPDGAALSLRDRIIIYDIRLPRVVLGVLVGAALAVSGAVMQGLFRNPLADPGLVGVSAGASLGAVAVIVLGATRARARRRRCFGSFALPLAAFCGGLGDDASCSTASRRGRAAPRSPPCCWPASRSAALAMALTGLLIFMADDRQLRDLTFWSLGSLAGATWTKIWRRRADHRAGAGGNAVPGARAERAGARRGDGRPSRHSGAAAEIRRPSSPSRRRPARRWPSAAASASSASSCRICCAC